MAESVDPLSQKENTPRKDGVNIKVYVTVHGTRDRVLTPAL
jgi:hypothetical protein